MRNFRLYAVLAGILLLAAAFAAVPAALAEGSGITVYEQHGDPFWFIPTVRCSDNDSIDFVTFKADQPITSIHVDFLAAVLGNGGEKYHFESPIYLTVIDLTNFTDWHDHVVTEVNTTFDWYDLDWTDWQSIDTVESHLVLDFGVALNPGYYGFAIWTSPSGAFPGELALISAYGEPKIIHESYNENREAWGVEFRYWHPIGFITATTGEVQGGTGGVTEHVKILQPHDGDVWGSKRYERIVVWSPEQPLIEIDDKVWGALPPAGLGVWMTWVDVEELGDGHHTITARAMGEVASVTITVQLEPENVEKAIKCEIVAPQDGTSVANNFSVFVTVSYVNISYYQIDLFINNKPVPKPADWVSPLPPGIAPPDTGTEPKTGESLHKWRIVDVGNNFNITPNSKFTIRAVVVAESDANLSASSEVTVEYTVKSGKPTGSVIFTGTGYKVKSDDAIAVIAHFGDHSVEGKQVGPGEWFVAASSPEAIVFAWSLPVFELIGPNGETNNITLAASATGWLQEPQFGTPVPGWAWVVLAIIALYILFGKRGKRHYHRRRR